jgi:hypothetical protein
VTANRTGLGRVGDADRAGVPTGLSPQAVSSEAAHPSRIRLSRGKGWRLPSNAVNVARPGKWGNPFVVGKDGTREQCVGLFYQLIRGFIDLGGGLSVDEQLAYHKRFNKSVGELRGKDLACWCALDGKPCHADILLAVANEQPLPKAFPREVTLPRVRLGMLASDLEREQRKAKRRKVSA